MFRSGRSNPLATALLAFLLAARVGHVEARVWRVTSDGTGDAPTIQAAIDSAQDGDEVVLAPGLYTHTTQGDNGEQYNVSMVTAKTGVNIRSEAGPETTVLDGEGVVRLIWCNDVGPIRIEGLTLTRGRGSPFYGGG